jgi:cell division protein FtsQ
VAVALVVVAALAVAYFAWFRDSSLVGVESVDVHGLNARDDAAAIAALTDAAKGMTTLDVDQGSLDSVAARFPEIASLSASADFPHGLTIDVVARPPVLLARDGGRSVPVAGDGELLAGADVPSDAKLPTLAVHQLPADGRLTGSDLDQAKVVGAAPAPLRRHISSVSSSHDDGIIATLRPGIEVRFGTPARIAAKWAAAAAVLADPHLTSASYVDVRVPRRPSVG